ncbi:MAG: nicotinate phosphoribosyltransferase [Chloroflexota bacterium]|nr:nicotinate phosphoribosyltransferase [Chloroflexota bacterium]
MTEGSLELSIFDRKRLKTENFALPVEALRRGFFADRYFANSRQMLAALAKEAYSYRGLNPREVAGASQLQVGEIEVEAQIFNRRSPMALIAGVDHALAQLRCATGYFGADGQWVDTAHRLEIDAVQDGVVTNFDGDPQNVLTVMEIRGRYRDFAVLETTLLGVLSRASRIATNVYEVLGAAGGKPVLFFPARFDMPEVQAIDGYAYWLALRRFHLDTGIQATPLASTDAQASLWGGAGVGTLSHAMIACFLADSAETMAQFARHIPTETPRILLADFNNDVVADSRATLAAFWPHYAAALKTSDREGMARWRLNGVRLDTSASLRDRSLPAEAEKGVSPQLVFTLREALNRAWEGWDVPRGLEAVAREFCRATQIVVSGGFNRERVARFEREGAPVDSYGIGSAFLSNDRRTNSDFTMDVVRVKVGGKWVNMSKVGRRPCDNPDLERVDFSEFD